MKKSTKNFVAAGLIGALSVTAGPYEIHKHATMAGNATTKEQAQTEAIKSGFAGLGTGAAIGIAGLCIFNGLTRRNEEDEREEKNNKTAEKSM